jgi:hypothetical protein
MFYLPKSCECPTKKQYMAIVEVDEGKNNVQEVHNETIHVSLGYT